MKSILWVRCGSRDVLVDVSNEACAKSGFKHAKLGTEIINPNGDDGIIIGVGSAYEEGPDTMYFAIKNNAGYVSHWGNVLNIKEVGFKLKR